MLKVYLLVGPVGELGYIEGHVKDAWYIYISCLYEKETYKIPISGHVMIIYVVNLLGR